VRLNKLARKKVRKLSQKGLTTSEKGTILLSKLFRADKIINI